MDNLKVDYFVEIEEIRQLGDYKFAAKARFSRQARARKWSVPLPDKEYWGNTKAEAEDKVREAVREWAEQCNVTATEIP